MARAYALKREGSAPAPEAARNGTQESFRGAEAGCDSLGLVNCSISHPKVENQDSRSNSRSPYDSAIAEAKNQRKLWYLAKSRVVGFKIYRKDLVPVRKAWNPNAPDCDVIRGDISELSAKSLRRLCLIANNTPVDFRSFITLTYPKEFPCDGKDVKRHLNLILTAIRKELGNVQYLWFLEFQKRGAPHFHIFLDYCLPPPLRPMKRVTGRRTKEVRVNWEKQDWLSERWFEIVGSGDEKHLQVGAAWEVVEKPDGMARYVAKEAYKTFQKIVPTAFRNVGRFWGTSRGVPPIEPETIDARLEELAMFLPPEMLGEDGQPFPICFEGAESYRKIIGTKKDPVIVRGWRNGCPQKAMTSILFGDGVKSIKPIPLHDQ